jgi:transcriptional regulator with XRE-family HTH domain
MEQDLNRYIGIKIRQKRIELNLTQTKVARTLNVTFQQIQKYEKGTNGLSANRIRTLSNYFNMPISYFFEGYEDFKQEFDLNNQRINLEFLSKLFTSLRNE